YFSIQWPVGPYCQCESNRRSQRHNRVLPHSL
ncbi:uncharacterized protein METZ01_LOCUS229570, partial [marine metagenome]